MEAVAHNPKFAKKAKIPQSVGRDFVAADAGREPTHSADAPSFPTKAPLAPQSQGHAAAVALTGKRGRVKGRGNPF